MWLFCNQKPPKHENATLYFFGVGLGFYYHVTVCNRSTYTLVGKWGTDCSEEMSDSKRDVSKTPLSVEDGSGYYEETLSRECHHSKRSPPRT